jgi:hypothetical protein
MESSPKQLRPPRDRTRAGSETLDVSQETTFAGFGFSMAAKALRERLIAGETACPGAPFPPITSSSTPKIPAIAKLFVKVPDAHIWLTTPPAGFLRYEGSLAEPSDQIVRIDLLPGGPSETATPVATSGK